MLGERDFARGICEEVPISLPVPGRNIFGEIAGDNSDGWLRGGRRGVYADAFFGRGPGLYIWDGIVSDRFVVMLGTGAFALVGMGSMLAGHHAITAAGNDHGI